MVDNVISMDSRRPAPPDPWAKAQPTIRSLGPREELWAHPYFGISHMIWATGSNNPPEPPTNGWTPVAANVVGHVRMAA